MILLMENIYENLDTWKFTKQIDQYNNLFKLSKESALNNLEDIDCKYGLSLSDWDIEYIHNNIHKWDNPIFYI